jgi:hypothetical protein
MHTIIDISRMELIQFYRKTTLLTYMLPFNSQSLHFGMQRRRGYPKQISCATGS